ncbi:MAG: hypothetical protein NTU97_01520 [Candidatus Magasanikbacteria bacterium]|nr:hypothetical protein [Candidatus Magasanikbacteria bacterium]
MEHNKATKNESTEEEKEMVLHFTKTFSDTAREPFLILNSDLVVVGANESFYRTFQVKKEETEDKLIYELGDGQWNIPELKNLLEKILPNERVFNNFEVSCEFPTIGSKTMVLNARKLDTTEQILLAIEDVTLEKAVQNKLADYTNALEQGVAAQAVELNIRIDELSKLNKFLVGRELKMVELKEEIKDLKKEKNV